ncbi:hypothetical protein ACFW04_008770 [Cataglyphis niger]
MVEVLLDRIDGQEVAIVDSNCIPGSPTKCSPTENSSAINEKLSPIQEFYYGQSIFLTGGTGFMGKLLIEKLLRTCSGVASIYLLVRPKKGKDVHQRTEEIFDDPLFTKLRDEQPKFRHQIVAIAGDCSQPNLGMSSQDRATIIREVSIVFHVAATLRFDEKLKLAVPINVRSTRDVLNLCKEISNLKSFVHVSTAYANCPQKVIEEKFYDSPMDSDKLIALMECVEDKLAEDITPQLLGKWPNTYTYTKAVGENVIRKQAGDLPVGIFRPAIVISTYKEPLRGWIDNLYGPTGVAAGAGTGLLRSIHCNGSVHANVVPADLTVNALIACAWDIANIRRLLKVYKKIHKFMDVLNYFSTQEWKFTNDRLHALLIKLTSKDRENFFCDIRDLDWNVYFETYISGIRIYLIKDPLDTLPQARLKWQKYEIYIFLALHSGILKTIKKI